MLEKIIEHFEDKLAEYYRFELQGRFNDYRMSQAELELQVGSQDLPSSGVILIEGKTGEDTFLGVKISDDVVDVLKQKNPLDQLSRENLNALCVLIEEISHFHLILNRANMQKPITKIEIEWQAEIDKPLICADILKLQSGKTHIQPLIRLMFDESHIHASTDKERYEQANKFAGSFWYSALVLFQEPTLQAQFREVLQNLYKQDWHTKKSFKFAA
mgnify:CR=1 FL=1